MTWCKRKTWQFEESLPCPYSGQISPLSTVSIIKRYLHAQGDDEATGWPNIVAQGLCISNKRIRQGSNQSSVKSKSISTAVKSPLRTRVGLEGNVSQPSRNSLRVRSSERSPVYNLATLCPCVTPVLLEVSRQQQTAEDREKAYTVDTERNDSGIRRLCREVRERDKLITEKDAKRSLEKSGEREKSEIASMIKYGKTRESTVALPTIASKNKAKFRSTRSKDDPMTTPQIVNKLRTNCDKCDARFASENNCNRVNTKCIPIERDRRKDCNNRSGRFNETSLLIRGFNSRYSKASVTEQSLGNQLNHRRLAKSFYTNSSAQQYNWNLSEKWLEADDNIEKMVTFTTPVSSGELRRRSFRTLTSSCEQE
eukprot:gene12765-14076_t